MFAKHRSALTHTQLGGMANRVASKLFHRATADPASSSPTRPLLAIGPTPVAYQPVALYMALTAS